MTIIVGGGGASSGSSGAISGGFKIFELMFNQSTGAALPDGTLRPAIFADKAAMQAYFTQHPTEFTRLKASGRVCEIGTIDAQGKPLTINNEAYSYVEGESDPWVDVVGGLVGPKGDQGPAGDISNLKVDYPLTINTVADETTIGAPEAITFKGGKIGEQDAHLDIDIARDCVIRFVTDNPAAAYNVVDAYPDASAPDGYYAKFGSRSLTTYLTSLGDIRTSIDGKDGVVYTSQNPQPITVDGDQIENIRLGETGLYSTYKSDTKEASIINRAPFSRTYNFNQDLTLEEPYDGITAIYTTQDPEVDHVLHLNLDPTDSRLHKDWIFTVAVDGDTASTLEVKVGKTTPQTYKVPAGFIVIELNQSQDDFVVHQMDTPIGIEGSDYANLANVEWKNLPTKEYIVTEGTLGGFGTGIDGKTGRLHVKVLNNAISASDTSWFIRHEITILSDDPDLSGRMFLKVAKSKDVFDAAKLVEVTGGLSQVTEDTPLEAVNPVDGSTHDAVNVTANELRFGSPTFKTEIRSNQQRIPVSISGGAYDEEIAYLSDITAGGDITVDGNLTEKIISGDNITSSYDAGSKTTTLNATGGGTPTEPTDIAGFGTVNEIPERLHHFTTHEANIQASYQDDDFEVKFSNGEAGPVFEVRVTEDSKSVWELGFDYTDKITDFDQVLGRVLIQYEPSKSTIPAKNFFDLVTLSCSKGQVKTFKKIHNNQDMAEFWVVATADNTDARYLLSFDMQGQGQGVAEFLVKPPKFVDYVIPWDQNRLPPQILLHQEGMNNQGKMGSGSNIDSGSIRQGKVYVEDFTPANGGPSGLPEGNAQKGFVIKWYGINDSESAGVFLFYNFVGDVYTKMNKSQGEKGDWKKLNNDSPQPIVPPSVDKDNPLEVVAEDGSYHDAIAINSTNDLVFGTRSSTVKSLTLATGATKIDVYRKDADSGSEIVDRIVMASELDQFKAGDFGFKFLADATPSPSGEFELSMVIGGETIYAGVQDLVELVYDSSSYYTYQAQLAAVKEMKLRTGEDYQFYSSVIQYVAATDSKPEHFTITVTSSSNQKKIGFSVGRSNQAASKGEDAVPVTYVNLMTQGTKDIEAGTYPLTGAGDADMLVTQWAESDISTYSMPLAIARTQPDNTYTVVGTNDRVKIVYTEGAGYSIVISVKIEDFGSFGYTRGYNQGSTVINQNIGRGKKTYYFRESDYTVTEDDIQHDLIIQAEPMVKDANGHYATTVTFPAIDVFTKYYYIPQVNEDQKNNLPHIENLNIQCWLDPERNSNTKLPKL